MLATNEPTKPPNKKTITSLCWPKNNAATNIPIDAITEVINHILALSIVDDSIVFIN